MRILADRRIRALFLSMGICVGVYILLSSAILILGLENRAVCVFLSALALILAIWLLCIRYLRGQDRILEGAVAVLSDYIAGDPSARIACDEEGELCRLFHQINFLAAVLDAQAQREASSRESLKKTIEDISHQLKTPLAALNIYNGILQEEARDLPAIREFTELSEQELDRIETLIQSLLKMARLDAGTVMLNKQPEDIRDILEKVKEHFAFRAAREGKEIRLESDGELYFSCDRLWLTEGLDNIVKNALDHTKAGDAIWISARRRAAVLQIVIRDNGSGIYPEDLYHIFKRFYRSRFSKDIQGVGLGLPLARSVIEMHGGNVEVDSVWGGGTVFTINFLKIPTRS